MPGTTIIRVDTVYNYTRFLALKEKIMKNKFLIIMIMFIFLCCTADLFAAGLSSKVKKANRLFENGKVDDALKIYRDGQVDAPESEIIHYNIANSLYRQGDFEGAGKEYSSVLSTDDIELEADAYYNLGNTYYRQGKFQEAIDSYKRCLQVRQDDEDAKYNIEFVRQKIKENCKKQQQQQQQQKQDKQQEQSASAGQQQKDDKKDDEHKEGQSSAQKREDGQSEDRNGQQDEKEPADKQEQKEEKNGSQDRNDKREGEKKEEPEPGKEKDEKTPEQGSRQQGEPSGENDMSKDDAQRILNAMSQAERDQLDKINKVQPEDRGIRVEKDW